MSEPESACQVWIVERCGPGAHECVAETYMPASWREVSVDNGTSLCQVLELERTKASHTVAETAQLRCCDPVGAVVGQQCQRRPSSSSRPWTPSPFGDLCVPLDRPRTDEMPPADLVRLQLAGCNESLDASNADLESVRRSSCCQSVHDTSIRLDVHLSQFMQVDDCRSVLPPVSSLTVEGDPIRLQQAGCNDREVLARVRSAA